MSVQESIIVHAIQQINVIHTKRQFRFVYVKINGQNIDIYGTDSRIAAVWHQFKYSIQCCCCSSVIMIGGDRTTAGRYSAEEGLKNENQRQVTAIVSCIRNAPDLATFQGYRKATADAGLNLKLSPSHLTQIWEAYLDKEAQLKREADRKSLPIAMQTTLNDIHNDVLRPIEGRLTLIREFLAKLGPDSIVYMSICFKEINFALKSIMKQMKEGSYLSSMNLEGAKKQIAELDELANQCSILDDSLIELVGPYALSQQPQLEKELTDEMERLKQEEEKCQKEYVHLLSQIEPLKTQKREAEETASISREHLQKLEKELTEKNAILSQSIVACLALETLSKQLEKAEALDDTSFNQSLDRERETTDILEKAKEKRNQCDYLQSASNNRKQRIEVLVDLAEQENLSKRSETQIGEITQKLAAYKKRLQETLARVTEIDGVLQPLIDRGNKILISYAALSHQSMNVVSLLDSFKSNDHNQIGISFLKLYGSRPAM